jgi:hypothetical protein
MLKRSAAAAVWPHRWHRTGFDDAWFVRLRLPGSRSFSWCVLRGYELILVQSEREKTAGGSRCWTEGQGMRKL